MLDLRKRKRTEQQGTLSLPVYQEVTRNQLPGKFKNKKLIIWHRIALNYRSCQNLTLKISRTIR